jgi:phosphoglycerol transferase MdoB-like AlkP superfamily enzyme
LSSFPPLPGDSIVKRDRSENVESIARVLKRDGYGTVFLYGGRGVFDSMKSYAIRNGWDRFLEHNPPFHDDFPHPKFTTVWGVCDEEVYDRAIDEFRAFQRSGQPFLGTIMSVSNHKPYTYPRGCIAEDPDKPRRTREKAVKYSDWCLGQFFQKARKEAFWTNTVFVVVADHGARVYGSQEIPIFSYEIPWVILGPAVVKEPRRIGSLGSSLDVSPTILGLIGRPYQTMFFGRDLLDESPPNNARALLNHNRDIGMYAQNQMVVLGLQKAAEYYEGDPKVAELKPASGKAPGFSELEKNTAAIYQVADELYMNRLYRIDGPPAGAAATSPRGPRASAP